jgi:hypothetical protein
MRRAVSTLLQRLTPDDRRIIVLTFEIFWIVIFLVEAATGSGGGEVAGFIYANF